MKSSPFFSKRVFTLRSLSLVLALAFCVGGEAATYYVDYEQGSDLNTGTSPGSPFKHCPGDDSAPPAIKNKQLFPGDKVIFKGGVEYRGGNPNYGYGLVLKWSGSAGSPIIYDGNFEGNFGIGRAIMMGADRDVAVWVRCNSPEEADYAADWMNCFYAVSDASWANDPFGVHLFYDGNRGVVARSPNAVDPLYYNRAKEDYHPLASSQITDFTITIPSDFDPPPAPGKTWENAWVSNWYSNDVMLQPVMSTSTDGTVLTVSGSTKSANKNSFFTLFNRGRLLDQRGEYVLADFVQAGDKRKLIFYAGPGGLPPVTTLTSSKRKTGLNLAKNSHVVIQGFKFTQFAGGDSGKGSAIYEGSNGGVDIVIRDCVLTENQSLDKAAVISILGADNLTIQSCLLSENQGSRGIALLAGSGQTVTGNAVENNTITRTGRTAIFVTSNQQLRITGNHLFDNQGLHGNGISVYAGCDGVTVARNVVIDCNAALTLQSARNVDISYNVLKHPGQNNTLGALRIYGPTSVDCENITIRNNVIMGEPQKSLSVSDQDNNGGKVLNLVLENNIIDGSVARIEKFTAMNKNLFLSKYTGGGAVTVGPNDYYAPAEKNNFVNAAANDFHLKPEAWAVDNGVAWSDAGGDLEGNAISGNRDVGAYEFQSGAGAMVLSAGKYHTVAVDANGAVWTWGRNANGQLGNGTTTDAKVPQQLATISGVKSVAAGALHTLALKPDGTVWTWGSGSYGQLGIGTTADSAVPVQVAGLSDVVKIGAGAGHSFAVKSDGTIWVWGRNNLFQLGLGNNVQKNTPQQVNITGVANAEAGTQHTLVVKTDGTVWAWGYNTSGQLGDGTTTNRSLPVAVPGLGNIVLVAAGGNHSVALTGDGSVYAWGANAKGQLGDGGTANRSNPQAVGGVVGVQKVAAGEEYTKILAGGAVWGCGTNALGQLGIGSLGGSSSTLVQIPLLSGVTDVVSGDMHGLHRMADGTLTAVGYNIYGQLGDNTATNRPSPVVSAGIDLD